MTKIINIKEIKTSHETKIIKLMRIMEFREHQRESNSESASSGLEPHSAFCAASTLPMEFPQNIHRQSAHNLRKISIN
jgi:hypothetical protein